MTVDETRALDPAGRIERLHAVEAEIRRLEAQAAVLVSQIGDDRAFRARGHLTISGFLRGELRWSPAQVTARRQLARAHRDSEANHDSRRLALSFHDGVGRITAQCGAYDYAQFAEIFERYRHAEFLTDWDTAVARYGTDDAATNLARSDTQRSWDALMRIALDAVSTPPGSQAPEPVVNLVCGINTIETHLTAAGLIPNNNSAEPRLPDLSFNLERCETSTGIPVTPADVVQAMFHGRIRRVVFDSAGVVVDAGRLRRLFDGAMRQLVQLHSSTCIFPGCNRPATWCQIDHLTDWQHGGTTTAANAGPMCARHNQLKNSGFTVWRDPNGVYHTYHPDGTEIAAPPPPPGAAPPTQPDAA
jgi:hypothetical protein